MSIGIWQLVLILVIIFVLFGAGKLPSVMKDVGKGVKNLKDGIKEGDAQAENTATMRDITPEESESASDSTTKKGS